MWRPTEENKDDALALSSAFAVMQKIAGEILILLKRSGLKRRKDLRSRFIYIATSSPLMDDSCHAIYSALNYEETKALESIELLRVPVIAVGEDVRELRMSKDSEVRALDEEVISATDEPVSIRFEAQVGQRLRGAVTRAFCWNGGATLDLLVDIVQCTVAVIARSVYEGLHLGMGYVNLDDSVLASLKAEGHETASPHIEQAFFLTSWRSWDDKPAVERGYVALGDCFSVCAKIRVIFGDSLYIVRIEEPLLVGHDDITRYPGTKQQPLCQGLVVQRAASERPLWVLSTYRATSNQGDSMFYKGSQPMSKARINEVSSYIEAVSNRVIGINKNDIAIITAKGVRMDFIRPFLLAMISEQRSDLKVVTAGPMRMLRDIGEQDPHEVKRYRHRMAKGFILRVGPWSNDVDTPALSKSIAILAEICDVYPVEVANYIRNGNRAIGPEVLEAKGWQRGEWSSRGHVKTHFLIGTFGMISKRYTFWQDMTADQKHTVAKSLLRLVQSNLHLVTIDFGPADSSLGSVDYELVQRHQVRWDDPPTRERGIRLLNRLAESATEPMPSLAIESSDWATWKTVMDSSANVFATKADQKSFRAMIHDAFKAEFISPGFAPKDSKSKLTMLVHILYREDWMMANPLSKGFTPEVFAELAIMLHVLKKDPCSADLRHSGWELDILHEIVPFTNRRSLPIALRQQGPQIRAAFKWVAEALLVGRITIEDVYGPHVDQEGRRAIQDWHQLVDQQSSDSVVPHEDDLVSQE